MEEAEAEAEECQVDGRNEIAAGAFEIRLG